VVREGDDEWFDIVQWTVFGVIAAEELGVTSANVGDAAANPASADIARLLGVGFDGGEVFDFGPSLGLEPGFMQDVIAAVGNFGEIYDRTIEPIGLAREGSLNDLWTRGGLIYSAPIR
jgi:general L-amino acid transport system substrate-binding protein